MAGFCSRPMDTLTLVSEPEAAAMYVLQAMGEKNFSRISDPQLSPLSLPQGENFVICDAGGGTVDLISYEVVEASPKLKLKESAVGTGAKCGSSYIDEAFLKLLRQRIGPSFDNEELWTQKHIGKGSPLMKQFDCIKKSLGQTRGFGESHYLYQRLVEWAKQQSPPLVVVNPSES
ncbi:hypothetical protein AA313_de0202975 [Arthrobotrys entomopaga]|nr:hypothetical protein AA313_de0202975 [Arthrobotrys entomopaga]